MPPPLLLSPADIDFTRVVANADEIRAVNPQRFEMEALTAIVLLDHERKLIAGYKDVGAHEFWCRGHMPGFPLMPGVMMCEAAAQLCSYYLKKYKVFDSEFVGLGGLNNVQFRKPVRPGDRLVIVAHLTRERRMMAECEAQGFVSDTMVFNATVQGVPLRKG
jgi:3-hydroxyacyl-[acyl-carrier-protein] dehydratase